MHYYSKNIADYRKDTAHLTLVEHGIYSQLIDTYYLDEKPIKTQVVIRRLSIKTEEELNALNNVLSDFFELSECGNFYTHGRIEHEITRYKEKAAIAKANGSKGGRPKKAKKTQRVNSANPEITKGKANQEPITNNQEPLLKDMSIVSAKPPACPVNEIIDLYHELCPKMPGVLKNLFPGSKRDKSLRARWKESPNHQTLEFWKFYFGCAGKEGWMNGEGNRAWFASFEYLVRKEPFIENLQKFLKDSAA